MPQMARKYSPLALVRVVLHQNSKESMRLFGQIGNSWNCLTEPILHAVFSVSQRHNLRISSGTATVLMRPCYGLYAASRCTRAIDLFLTCQRSYCICSPSQRSALVSNAFDKRMDISALTPALRLRTAESVWRVTPRRFATSTRVSVSGKYSRNTSPGCGGLCILLIVTSVVIRSL